MSKSQQKRLNIQKGLPMTSDELKAREEATNIIMNVFGDFDPVEQEVIMTLDADKANRLQEDIETALRTTREEATRKERERCVEIAKNYKRQAFGEWDGLRIAQAIEKDDK